MNLPEGLYKVVLSLHSEIHGKVFHSSEVHSQKNRDINEFINRMNEYLKRDFPEDLRVREFPMERRCNREKM